MAALPDPWAWPEVAGSRNAVLALAIPGLIFLPSHLVAI